MSAKLTQSSAGLQLEPDKSLLDGMDSRVRSHEASPGASSPRAATEMRAGQHHTVIHSGDVIRLAIMVTPEGGGHVRDQAWEALSMIRAILRNQEQPMVMTMQTVFVAEAADVPAIKRLFEAYFDEEMPLTLFVVQPPCDGAKMAVEAWAISTDTVEVGFHGPHLLTVEHDDLRWIYASAGAIHLTDRSAYEQSTEAFSKLGNTFKAVGVPFRDVSRLWLYQGGITEEEGEIERYRELNRGRTEFFDQVDFSSNPLLHRNGDGEIYPASTGIGTAEHGLVIAGLAIQTDREDVGILSLENPQQMSAFDYPKEYSKKSPKFSRATAIRMGRYLTTWVSGTASIINAETIYPDSAEKQTEQTLDNIENLIAAENFERQGWRGAGARLQDLAKIRVYVKHPEDFEICRAVCERRLGQVPAVFAHADVCRPDLLVEIEGVAFSEISLEAEGTPA